MRHSLGKGLQRQKDTKGDVEQAVAIEVGGDGTAGAIAIGKPVRREGVCAPVFEPGDAVVRLEDVRLIEDVAVGKKHVEIAVTVKVDEVEANCVVPSKPVGALGFGTKTPLLNICRGVPKLKSIC